MCLTYMFDCDTSQIFGFKFDSTSANETIAKFLHVTQKVNRMSNI